MEGTLIRLAAGRLPGDRNPEPLWLWSSRAATSAAEVDRAWQAFPRRFDIEHMFRQPRTAAMGGPEGVSMGPATHISGPSACR